MSLREYVAEKSVLFMVPHREFRPELPPGPANCKARKSPTRKGEINRAPLTCAGILVVGPCPSTRGDPNHHQGYRLREHLYAFY